MSPSRPPPAPTSGRFPYDYESAAREIQAFVDRHERGTLTRLATAAGVSTQNFRHCLNQTNGNRFSIERFAAIAAEAAAIEHAHDIGGWPFCSWEEALAIAAVRKVLAHKR